MGLLRGLPAQRVLNRDFNLGGSHSCHRECDAARPADANVAADAVLAAGVGGGITISKYMRECVLCVRAQLCHKDVCVYVSV